MYVITYIKNIIFIYIIFYLRLIKSDKFISKEDVLKIKDEYYIRFYCKDDICSRVDRSINKYFMEFPSINNNTTTYIVYTCTYDNIEFNRCYNDTYIGNEKYSLKCNNDLECLSNECYKNHCMFNDKTPIVHCDDIYSNKWYLRPSSYMHCGKPPGDICIENDECSSMSCA